MTTHRNPIDDEPLTGGLYDDEYPAAHDDYGDGLAVCVECNIDFEPTGASEFYCDECYYELGIS